jgi:hypothetical protein
MTARTASVVGYAAAGVGTLFLFFDSLLAHIPFALFIAGCAPGYKRA